MEQLRNMARHSSLVTVLREGQGNVGEGLGNVGEGLCRVLSCSIQSSAVGTQRPIQRHVITSLSNKPLEMLPDLTPPTSDPQK